jgi:hypothetical protein
MCYFRLNGESGSVASDVFLARMIRLKIERFSKFPLPTAFRNSSRKNPNGPSPAPGKRPVASRKSLARPTMKSEGNMVEPLFGRPGLLRALAAALDAAISSFRTWLAASFSSVSILLAASAIGVCVWCAWKMALIKSTTTSFFLNSSWASLNFFFSLVRSFAVWAFEVAQICVRSYNR